MSTWIRKRYAVTHGPCVGSTGCRAHFQIAFFAYTHTPLSNSVAGRRHSHYAGSKRPRVENPTWNQNDSWVRGRNIDAVVLSKRSYQSAPLAARKPGAHSGPAWSIRFSYFRLRLLQNRDIGIGIFPPIQEFLVGGFCLCVISG